MIHSFFVLAVRQCNLKIFFGTCYAMIFTASILCNKDVECFKE